ncbi:SDR family NAD(P)-dependent oxidoreductase [Paenibacillus sp. CGMCC 1.16610]|uniref:SDR family NAD(P)-dependent oxidoreductase n=1 Tax=Paenibacillus anseongense TaxID=2682845 RepID=A0ABW9UHJ4_9BACL|nr:MULTISPECIES: SDR family NAD(P)-dependent oxidoreductase [Paenibacillus]MBA2938584.1 SDR family NAD(P)-dependent oxidoreductase [Paenibacillus sp. CGMCC 1.16610]MVQ38776.1 SDR family NAD(P)-dependent oxidoreductase [Paenibacillus anseongense]
MKKAIVIGATGGTGAAITEELVKRGVETIAFGRSRQKLEEFARKLGNPQHLTLSVGDAMRPEDIVAQAGGADVLFHCANVPYHEMVNKLIPLGESVMEAAERLTIKVVAIDGIYPYGRKQMELVTEDHPKQPHTIKGNVRLDYERMLFSQRWTKAQVMIVRLPDYYGPTANEASYLGSTLEAIAAGKLAFFIGNMQVPREFVYLPDAAAMVAELAGKDFAYGQNWHIPGSGLISGREIVRIARSASGIAKPVIPLKKLGLSLIGMSVPVMKEVVEMLYLTEEPLVLSGEKYKRLIGPIVATSFKEGITSTVRVLQKRKDSFKQK